MVPARSRVFGQLVESPVLWSMLAAAPAPVTATPVAGGIGAWVPHSASAAPTAMESARMAGGVGAQSPYAAAAAVTAELITSAAPASVKSMRMKGCTSAWVPHAHSSASSAAAAVDLVSSVMQHLDCFLAPAAAAAASRQLPAGAVPLSHPHDTSAPTLDPPSLFFPMRELHVDGLYDAGQLRPLGAPFEVLDFQLASPPEEGEDGVERMLQVCHRV